MKIIKKKSLDGTEMAANEARKVIKKSYGKKVDVFIFQEYKS